MRDYASRIRDTRDQMAEQETETNGLMLRTKVEVESARTELSRGVEHMDRASLLAEKEASRKRGLASAEEAVKLMDGARPWMTTQKCKAFLKPNSSGQPVGFFEGGKKLLGKEAGAGWVEITNGTGKSVFIEAKCGDYKD